MSRIPSPRTLSVALGAGRTALGGAFLVAPQFSVRILGLDSATAARVSWLARMAAARDVGLGLGALSAAALGRDSSAWVAAGAAADAVDAAAIAVAVRQRRLGGVGARGLVAGAAAAALVGFWAAGATRVTRRS
jgi:hypothetical protein